MTRSCMRCTYRRCKIIAVALAGALMPLADATFAQQPLGPEYERWGLTGGEILRYYDSPSPRACRDDCDNNAECKGYTWVKPGGQPPHEGSVCYLMRSYAGAARHACCTASTRGAFPGQ